MLWFIGASTIPAFLVSYVCTSIMRRRALAWGLVDQPAARKVHVTPTPLGGGVGIYLGVLLPLLAAQLVALWIIRSGERPVWLPAEFHVHVEGVLYRSGQLWAVLAGGTILVVMGILDDRFGLSWKVRLVIQFLVAGALVAGGIRATVFVSQPWVGAGLSLLWMVVLINALNFLDNMDGLSAGIGLIAAIMFASVMLTATGEPRWLVGGCLLVLAGALAGFLMHNWPPAKIFMGDAGSTFIGMLLASMTILGTFYEESLGPQRHVMLAPLCVLAIPLYDFSSVMIIRLLEGRSPFQPDKSHFSHRLTDLGLSRRNAVLTVHFSTLATGLGALLLYRVQSWAGAALVVALVVCMLVIVSILETAGRKQRLQHEQELAESS